MQETEAMEWSQRIPPKSSANLSLPEGYAIEVTSIRIVDAPAVNLGNVEVTAKVKTLVCGMRTDGQDDEPSYREQVVSLGTIDTSKEREIQVNILFTPMNMVEVFNPCDGYIELVGEVDELDADLEEEEEEEDTNESIPADEIQARFRMMAENPPPQRQARQAPVSKVDADEENDE